MSGQGGEWALAAGARDLWGRLRAGWRTLPRAAWRRWFGWLLAGFGVCCVLSASLTLLARGRVDAGLQAWDHAQLMRLVERGPLSFHDALWWEAFGASSMLIPVVLTSVVLALRAGRPLLGLTLAASYVLAKPLVLVGWQLWNRARPADVANGIASPPLHSYPSGHAVQTAAIYGLLVYLWLRRSGSWIERGVAVLLWAALVAVVGLARLRLGTHWPSDVLAGTGIGIAWLAALLVALRRGEAAGGR